MKRVEWVSGKESATENAGTPEEEKEEESASKFRHSKVTNSTFEVTPRVNQGQLVLDDGDDDDDDDDDDGDNRDEDGENDDGECRLSDSALRLLESPSR